MPGLRIIALLIAEMVLFSNQIQCLFVLYFHCRSLIYFRDREEMMLSSKIKQQREVQYYSGLGSIRHSTELKGRRKASHV